MYLSFHLEFKICCIHIFSKRKLVYFCVFFFVIQQHLKEPQFTGVGGYTYMKL
jgi:hypothetical protein